MSQVNHKAVTS